MACERDRLAAENRELREIVLNTRNSQQRCGFMNATHVPVLLSKMDMKRTTKFHFFMDF
jgi:hypothetical protein